MLALLLWLHVRPINWFWFSRSAKSHGCNQNGSISQLVSMAESSLDKATVFPLHWCKMHACLSWNLHACRCQHNQGLANNDVVTSRDCSLWTKGQLLLTPPDLKHNGDHNWSVMTGDQWCAYVKKARDSWGGRGGGHAKLTVKETIKGEIMNKDAMSAPLKRMTVKGKFWVKFAYVQHEIQPKIQQTFCAKHRINFDRNESTSYSLCLSRGRKRNCSLQKRNSMANKALEQ